MASVIPPPKAVVLAILSQKLPFVFSGQCRFSSIRLQPRRSRHGNSVDKHQEVAVPGLTRKVLNDIDWLEELLTDIRTEIKGKQVLEWLYMDQDSCGTANRS